MRGYFGIGIEGASKAMNVGSLFRSAHAFGASFDFTVAAAYARKEGARSDTSDTLGEVPFYSFPDVESMVLPRRCALIGVELMDESTVLPSFRHPRGAAYVLGHERGSLSPAILARCDHVVRIPTAFSLNLGIAGALVMYDRLVCLGRFAPRPVWPGGPLERPPEHVFGDPIFRKRAAAFAGAAPPEGDA
jgi:tRNA G18 (ribose-2'-O)-methylase SpoU